MIRPYERLHSVGSCGSEEVNRDSKLSNNSLSPETKCTVLDLSRISEEIRFSGVSAKVFRINVCEASRVNP